MKKIAIYLAGSIQKGHEAVEGWTQQEIDLLQKALRPREVSFLNPALRTDDLSDPYSLFGRDMLQVFSCHVVLVDARDRRGLGVGAEMMWAKINQLPVVTWAPAETHYNRRNTSLLGVPIKEYIHPFVYSLSDQIALDLQDAAKAIVRLLAKDASIKGKESIRAAMQHYVATQFERDLPMKQLLGQSERLQQRLQLI